MYLFVKHRSKIRKTVHYNKNKTPTYTYSRAQTRINMYMNYYSKYFSTPPYNR